MNNPNILFIVDLTDLSSQIAPHAEKINKALNGNLYILFVADEHRIDSINDPVKDNEIKKVINNFNRFIETNFKSSPFKAAVVFGNPAEEILNYSTKKNIQIIMVGGKKQTTAVSLMVRWLKD
jgi:nucleotide-binding universal stress UspA family protein